MTDQPRPPTHERAQIMTELTDLMLELHQRDPKHIKGHRFTYREILAEACQSRGWGYETGYYKEKAMYAATVGTPIFRTAYSLSSEGLALARAYKAALESIKPTPNAVHHGVIRHNGNNWVATEKSKLIATRDIRAGEEIVPEKE
jgi:hypothetical protein